MARPLGTTVDQLLADDRGEDVVIRPTWARGGNGAVQWVLSRPHDPSGRIVAKMRIPASRKHPEPQVHPGRDWFYVLDGTARLLLGDREHLVEAGQAAEFDTMTPHWIAGHGAPVEILKIFTRISGPRRLTARGSSGDGDRAAPRGLSPPPCSWPVTRPFGMEGSR